MEKLLGESFLAVNQAYFAAFDLVVATAQHQSRSGQLVEHAGNCILHKFVSRPAALRG